MQMAVRCRGRWTRRRIAAAADAAADRTDDSVVGRAAQARLPYSKRARWASCVRIDYHSHPRRLGLLFNERDGLAAEEPLPDPGCRSLSPRHATLTAARASAFRAALRTSDIVFARRTLFYALLDDDMIRTAKRRSASRRKERCTSRPSSSLSILSASILFLTFPEVFL